MGNEQDRVAKSMENMARGNDYGNKLVYDRNTRTVKPISKIGRDPDTSNNFMASDFEFFRMPVGGRL